LGHARAVGVVFVANAAILVLELTGARMVAPYVGVTLETYTALIGVVLAAIAAGAWLGGRLADRLDPASVIAPVLVAGAALTALAPALIRLVGAAVRDGGAGSLGSIPVAAAGLFLPALVLSAITPLVAKLRLRSLTEAGGVVGGMSAAATLGALAGTFATGFVFVAELPTTRTVLGVAVVLAVVALATSPRPASSGVALLALVPAAGLSATVRDPCDRETTYSCARIVVDPERPSGRLLVLDTVRHSYVDLADPTHLEFAYARAFAAAIDGLHPGTAVRALHVGGGGFTFPRYLAAARPGSVSVVLELDPGLPGLARDRLGLVTGPDLVVRTGDARILLRDEPAAAYDLVLGDAFGGLTVPWQLTTREFADDVKRRLAPGGRYVLNVIDYPPLDFARAELATLQAVFADVALIARPATTRGERGGNLVLVASDAPLDTADIARRAARGELTSVLHGPALTRFVAGAGALRDDFAPVDQLRGRAP
jgi:spermidine synthase